MKKKPEFKDKKFKNDKEFKFWLDGTVKYTVSLEDKGQDFLKFYIDKGGEILHAEPFQSSIWNGKIVDTLSIEVGKKILFNDGKSLNYKTVRVIKKIVKRKDPNLKPCPVCGIKMVKTVSNFQTCSKGHTKLHKYTSPWARKG